MLNFNITNIPIGRETLGLIKNNSYTYIKKIYEILEYVI